MLSLQRGGSCGEGVARGQSPACILASGCCHSALKLADSRELQSLSTQVQLCLEQLGNLGPVI